MHEKILHHPEKVLGRENERLPGNLVVCCSMAFRDEALNLQKQMEILGISTTIPVAEGKVELAMSPAEFSCFKAEVVRRYFKLIADPSTRAILILNIKKRGKENYIGANTLMEMAIAFHYQKPIYLLNSLPGTDCPGYEEVECMKPSCLNGNIGPLASFFKEEKE